MNTHKMTQKVQEALQEAQGMALRLGHGEWDGEHLLSVLVGGAGGIIPILLGRMGVPADGLSAQLPVSYTHLRAHET